MDTIQYIAGSARVGSCSALRLHIYPSYRRSTTTSATSWVMRIILRTCGGFSASHCRTFIHPRLVEKRLSTLLVAGAIRMIPPQLFVLLNSVSWSGFGFDKRIRFRRASRARCVVGAVRCAGSVASRELHKEGEGRCDNWRFHNMCRQMSLYSTVLARHHRILWDRKPVREQAQPKAWWCLTRRLSASLTWSRWSSASFVDFAARDFARFSAKWKAVREGTKISSRLVASNCVVVVRFLRRELRITLTVLELFQG